MSSRLRSELVWRSPEPRLSAQAHAVAAPRLEADREQPEFAAHLAAREQAIRLLWVGAEVEHALMVQYLYAAYSLNLRQSDAVKSRKVQGWRGAILEIAREEMGHLATVENLLTLIGGPLHLDREDFPIADPNLWPFPFELEPLTKLSLAKYVLAETPSEEVLAKLGLKNEIDEIKRSLEIEGDLRVHRVGLIYDKINRLFSANPMPEGPSVAPYTNQHPSIRTADIQSASEKYQVTPGAWGLGYHHLLIETAHDRESAQNAIKLVSEQGEGTSIPANLDSSHFGKFLKIYREFPDAGAWRASTEVATNPVTKQHVHDPARKIKGEASLWAELSNLRYQMLLLYLHHSFLIESAQDSAPSGPRGSLVSWAFGEMYNLRSLAEILMTMPLQPGSSLRAGPPFEMPYTLALPGREADRWRAHRDLLLASLVLTAELGRNQSEHSGYLESLLTSDKSTLAQVDALVGA